MKDTYRTIYLRKNAQETEPIVSASRMLTTPIETHSDWTKMSDRPRTNAEQTGSNKKKKRLGDNRNAEKYPFPSWASQPLNSYYWIIWIYFRWMDVCRHMKTMHQLPVAARNGQQIKGAMILFVNYVITPKLLGAVGSLLRKKSRREHQFGRPTFDFQFRCLYLVLSLCAPSMTMVGHCAEMVITFIAIVWIFFLASSICFWSPPPWFTFTFVV